MALITLTPSSQLTFQRPLTQLIKRTILITSVSSLPIRWKVKTTAPKQYSVRPNGGTIEPGETVEVAVLLQPMKEDPAPGTKCRDKFLVQSIIINSEREASGLTDLWALVEQESKTLPKDSDLAIHEQKIRCTYLPAASDAITSDAGMSGAETGADDSMSSVLVHPATSTPSTLPSPTASILPASLLTSVAADSTADPTAKEAPSTVTSPFQVPASVSTTPSASSSKVVLQNETTATLTTATSKDDDFASVRTQLVVAQAEIARLTAALKGAEESGLRQRNVGVGGASVGLDQKVVAVQPAPEGVPLQVVVGIAAGVFIFTWLFF